ncbi:MAG: type II toxin-antitoxin system VapC family toxin [Gaiellaceae bacterium]
MLYVDASALMKLVRREAETTALETESRRWPTLVTSVLGVIELRRAAQRERVSSTRVEAVLARLNAIELDAGIRETAGTLEHPLRTLDAIHLATAISLEDELGAFACYDARLVQAATTEGFVVVSPS